MRITALFLSFLLLFAPCLARAEEDFPHAIWAPLDRFAEAMESGNDAGMYEYGLQLIEIMEKEPDSHLKQEFLAGKYEQVSRCAERLGYYDEAL